MATPFMLTESHEKPSGDHVQEPHERIEWLDIHGDGTETARTGAVWASAPPLGGQTAVWVLPDHPDPSDASRALLVRLVTRRFRAGRVMGVRWFARQGRWIDAGETVRETHPSSPFRREEARRLQSHRHAPPRGVPNETEMAAFARTVAELSVR
jgi:hypothetical protein